MKTISFVSRRKMMAQGLEAAIASRPELELKMLPMIPPQNVRTDPYIYKPDLMILDVTREMQQEDLFPLCGELRKNLPHCSLVLLLSENEAYYQVLSIRAKKGGLADDFVFYDNSMDYLLAKLAAL